MKTIEFLAKVLAPEHNYVLFLARRGGATWNENHVTLARYIAAIKAHDTHADTTVYMAIGAFADNVGPHEKTGRDYVQRRKHQATKFKTLAVDLDVGEQKSKYTSQREALQALARGCGAIGIPTPMVVLSGTGAHAYWPFTESINATLWEKLSLCLRAGLESQGVKLDVSKVSDRSMVLRPVGAHHKKDPDNWKEVRLVHDAPERSAEKYANVLIKFSDLAKPVQATQNSVGRRKSAVMDALLGSEANIKLDDLKRCPQLAALLASGGATDAAGDVVIEPLWRTSLGVAKFCEDKEAAAVQLSSGHPDYDYDDCMEKMEGWSGTGPATCASFENYCPAACETCEHKGRIASPAQLDSGMVTIVSSAPDAGKQEKLQIPRGYTFRGRNTYYKQLGQEEEEFVAPYRIWIVARVTDAEENTNSAKIAVEFPRDGVKIISIDSAVIAAGEGDLRKALADKQVYISGDIYPLKRYFMTFLRRLQNAIAADVSYTHFGWQSDGTFLIGEELLGSHRATIPHLEGVATAYKSKLARKGDLGTWVEATRIFDLPGMEFQNFAMLIGLGAPMQQGAHFPSALINLYSKDSGSGKTLTGKFGLSAWGNPEVLGVKAKDTSAAFYKNFGTLSSMGAYVDEMTTMDVDSLRAFVMSIQDGMEKNRLKADAAGFRDAAKWRMPIITSSNKDMYEQLGGGIASEAEELRVLQLTCPRVPYLEEHGTRVGYKLQVLIENNHGLAGPLFVSEVIRRGGPEVVYEAMLEDFHEDFGFDFLGQERFYLGETIIGYTAGKIYTALGLIKFDYRKGIQAVLDEVLVLRHNRNKQAFNGFDVLSQFLTEKQSEIVYFTTTPTNSYAMQPTPRSAIARVEVEVDAHDRVLKGMIFINRTGFQKWASRNGAEVRSTIEQMRRAGASIAEHTRKTLYKGVVGASASGQTHCFSIDIMSHTRLIAACDDSKPEPDAVAGRQRLEEVDK